MLIMILRMFDSFFKVFVHSLRRILNNSIEEETQTRKLRRKRIETFGGSTLFALAFSFLSVFWIVALRHYFAVSTIGMVSGHFNVSVVHLSHNLKRKLATLAL